MSVFGARFNRWWIALWSFNCAVLLALLSTGASPKRWATAGLVLFILPEMIGLVHRNDSLPPLTYAVRRYVPRWVPDALTWGIAGWMLWAWSVSGRAVHPLIVAILVFGVAGWLTNHWDVTYDGPGE